MSYYKTIIVTKPSTLSEMYIKDGINGFAIKKDENEFLEKLAKILQDKNKQKEIGINARKDFEENYSRYNMGTRIGKQIKI